MKGLYEFDNYKLCAYAIIVVLGLAAFQPGCEDDVEEEDLIVEFMKTLSDR